jgi:hypothetical protein
MPEGLSSLLQIFLEPSQAGKPVADNGAKCEMERTESCLFSLMISWVKD